MMLVLLLGAVPLDPVGDPLPNYLNESQAHQAVDAMVPLLKSCGTESDVTVRLELDFSGDGRIDVHRLDGVSGPVAECWTAALASISGPVHHDTPQRVSTSIYVRGGDVLASPTLTVGTRDIAPLLIFSTPQTRGLIYSVIQGTEAAEQ